MDALKNILQLIQDSIPPIHKEGHKIIFIFGAVSVLLAAIYEPLGWIGLVLTLWCIYFFRDPKRMVPQNDSLIISPADGVVTKIEEAPLPLELEESGKKVIRVSIFLNVFNVHVNRIPIAGKIKELYYHPGKFVSANLDKASEDNERQSVLLETKGGKKVAFVQIAGLVARRIICTLEEKQDVEAGERYGIIRFGSRVDVYLPEGVKPSVVVGQTAIGGETIIANLSGKSTVLEAKEI